MSRTDDEDVHVTAQVIGAGVAAEATARAAAEASAQAAQDRAWQAAQTALRWVRDFIDGGSILGSDLTKHGEIAEQIEVGVRRAHDFVMQNSASATFEGVGRTAAEDYLVDGVAVQSKFVNGVSKNLEHVLDHMRKYPDFGRADNYYHIPKDHFEVVRRIATGEPVEGLSARSVRAIQEKLEAISELSGGRSLGDVVRPGVSKYAEVQRGVVHETLDRHEREVAETHTSRKQEIAAEHGPSLGGAAKAAGMGVVAGASVRVAGKLYADHKKGKNVFRGDYTVDDWKELGVESLKGGLQGGIAGGAIYTLTQFGDMAAPFAGAVVSTGMAVGVLCKRYLAGEISFDEFVDLGQLACFEGAVVGLATAAGQALIPVPVLGAALGAITGKWLASLAKDHLGQESRLLSKRLEAAHAERMGRLDSESQRFVDRLMAEYDKLGRLTDSAFDLSLNTALRLGHSVALASAHGVAEASIIYDEDELDEFMFK